MALPPQASQRIEPVDVRCRKCKSLLKVTVLPAMCPRCRTPVSVANPVAVSQPVPTFQPATQSDESDKPLTIPRWVWAIAGGVILLIMGIFLFDDLRLRLHNNLAALNPPIAATTPPAPPVTPPAQISPAPTPLPVPLESAPPVSPTTTQQAPPPPPPPPPPRPFAALAAVEPYKTPPISPSGLQDAQIVGAIKTGVQFLKAQFVGDRLKDDGVGTDRYEGLDTLCVYALMHAGLAVGDPDLTAQAPVASGMIERVKSFPMNGSLATYGRSLRLQLLSLASRREDRPTIETDFAWMLKSSLRGAYTYTYTPPVSERQPRPLDVWDNSNSQYGALGVWAAGDSGFHPAGTYWQEVTQHWESAQQPSGGWTYTPSVATPTLSMTAAGVSILFTARDQTAADTGLSETRPTPLSPAIEDGLSWLDEDDHSVTLSSDHPGYTLYGMERAGLASGYKFFGQHDWYLELAANSVASQQKDGSWTGGDGTLAETAFRLLFLSRGRHPIILSKLRYDGDWAYRPRDVPNLTKYASEQLEVPLNWQTVDLQRSALEWSDSPVLLLSGAAPPTLTDNDIAKFGQYIKAGGLLFTLSNKDSKPFTDFAVDLAAKLFPGQKLAPIPADHPIYNSIFALKPDEQFPLMGVSNGSRLLMVHAPSDLARRWHPRYEKVESNSLQMGTNIVLYSAGRRDLRHRSETINISLPSTPPLATVPIARLSYSGNWDPEPGAWERMTKLIQVSTGLRCDVQSTSLQTLQATQTPIAHLTGTAAVNFSPAELVSLRQFVTDGGVLLIDSCGSDAFANSVKAQFLDKLNESLDVVGADTPIATIASPGMKDLSKPHLRIFSETKDLQPGGHLFILHHGSGDVIFTPMDVTSGLLGTNTWGISGYTPEYAEAIVNNVVVWGAKQAERIIGK